MTSLDVVAVLLENTLGLSTTVDPALTCL